MGDGWETRRRREPGNDWLIIKLGKYSVFGSVMSSISRYQFYNKIDMEELFS